MIFFDTETTSLITNTVMPLKQQPKIIEFAAMKVDNQTLEILDEFEQLINPGEPISDEVTKITSITNEMLEDQPTFPLVYPKLVDFFLGQQTMVAHNLGFDRSILEFELQRIDCLTKFPWPSHHICSIEITEHLQGKRLSLTNLHKHLFDVEQAEAHRAMPDVRTMFRCYRELIKRHLI